MGPVTCRPTGSTRPANIKNEYSVTFTLKAVRDAVRGAASRLGACAEPCGIRLEVPDFLQADFRALENIAFRIKRKHPNMRRNVKLDDDRLGVIMDIKVSENAEWSRILPEHARAASGSSRPSGGARERTLGAADLEDLVDD